MAIDGQPHQGDEVSTVDDTVKTSSDGIVKWSESAGRWVPVYKKKSAGDGAEDDEDQEKEQAEGSEFHEPTRLPTKRSPIGRIMQWAMLNAANTSRGALCTCLTLDWPTIPFHTSD